VINLKQRKCVVLFDFTKFHETSAFKLHDLNITIYTKDDNNNLHHEFFDFFSEEPRDYRFTFEALKQLGQIVDFTYFSDGVHFWSDNGFRKNQCCISFIPYKMNGVYQFLQVISFLIMD
jgi:hypothetical protein